MGTNLLNYLATSPATPQALLDHIVELALTPIPHGARYSPTIRLRWALVSNSRVSDDQVRDLLVAPPDARAHILTGLFKRTDLDDVRVLELLGGDTSATTLVAALNEFRQTDGTLSRHAYENSRSTQVWALLVAHDHHPIDLRWAAAYNLAASGRTMPVKTAKHVGNLARERVQFARTHDEHTHAAQWVADLLAATKDSRLIAQLTPVAKASTVRFKPAPVGGHIWLRSPHTTVEDVLAWVRQDGRVPTWLKAMTAACDTRGAIAVAARAAHPSSPRVAARALTSRAPLPDRIDALDLLLEGGANPALAERYLTNFLPIADRAWATRRLRHTLITSMHLATFAKRTDLTSDDLNVAIEVHERLEFTASLDTHYNGSGSIRFGAWVATYPSATGEQRRYGQRLAETAAGLTENKLAANSKTMATLALGLLDEPAHVVGARIPLALIESAHLATSPGIAWLLAETVAAHLPATFNSDAARVLTMLADGFPGTLDELFTTATTIAG